MSKLTIQFFPSARLPEHFFSGIQTLIKQSADAIIPETPNNSMIFTALLEDKLIGYASVTVDPKSAKVTSLYIEENKRGQLFAFKLMLDILDKLSKTGCEKIRLDCSKAQVTLFKALGFSITKELRRLGKHQDKKYFELENPCPAFFLSTLKHTLKTRAINLETFRKNYLLLGLAQDTHHYQYTTQQEFLAFHRNMLSQAQKQIWLISDTITSPLLNDEIVRDSLLRLAKRNAQANIKILLEDDKKGAGHYNPTIELAQKLTSFIEIRTIQKSAKKPNEMITSVDFTAGIFRKDLDNYTGFAHYNNPLIAQRLRDNFDQHWQYAKPSLQLRRLSI